MYSRIYSDIIYMKLPKTIFTYAELNGITKKCVHVLRAKVKNDTKKYIHELRAKVE